MIKNRNFSLLSLLIISMLFYCLDYFFRISPSLVLPQMLMQYHISPLAMGSTASIFYLGYVLLQLPAGYFLDRYNYNWVMAISAGICTALYWLFLYLHNYPLGLIVRGLTGAFSVLSFIGALHLARCYFPLKYFGLISGITIALGTVTAAFTQTLCALLMKWLNWHIVFSGMAGVGFILTVLFLVPRFSTAKQIILHNNHSNNAKLSIKDIWRLLTIPGFFLNALAGGLLYMPTSIFAGLWGITFLNLSYHLSKTASSFAILIIFIGWAIGSPIIGYLGGHLKKYFLLSIISTTLLLIISYIFIHYTSIGNLVFILLFLFGLLSSVQVLVWHHFNQLCPLPLTSSGIALTNMIIMLSTSCFHLFAGALIGTEETVINLERLQFGLMLIPLAFGVSLFLLFILSRKTFTSINRNCFD